MMANNLYRDDDARPVIVWFRDDLRLSDNPALNAAAELGRPIVCVFVHDEKTEGLRPLGGAARCSNCRTLSRLEAASF
jgi:deoxyribodipyrimidine photo-lyase